MSACEYKMIFTLITAIGRFSSFESSIFPLKSCASVRDNDTRFTTISNILSLSLRIFFLPTNPNPSGLSFDYVIRVQVVN